jgi:hypothetical protein
MADRSNTALQIRGSETKMKSTAKRNAPPLFMGPALIFVLLNSLFLCAQESRDSTKDKNQAATASEKTGPKPVVNAATDATKPSMTAKPAPAKKEYAYAAFWPSRFQMGVTYRGRLEKPSGRSFAHDAGDGYYLSRFRLEATFKLNKYIDLFGMAQDARVYQYNDLSKRPSGMTDALDLRQAYADFHIKKDETSFAFRIGTQYIDLGSKRLVGTSSWSNSPAVYHAAKVKYSHSGMALDVFAATRVSNIYPYEFNEPKKGENLYGSYLSLEKLLPKAKVEPYLFWRTQPSVIDELKRKGDSDLITVGLRLFGKFPNNVEYTSEFAFQHGTYAQDDISAWAGTWGLGYVLGKSTIKPKALFEYNYASGDGSKGDGTRGTFDQLYASNHSNYGIADQVGWRNTSNYKMGFEFEATKRFKIQFDVNDFYLATLQDALYSDNGSAVITNTKAISKHIGVEPDLQLTFKMNNQVTLGAGYGRLIPGKYLKDSTSGYSYNYPYIYWEFKY